MTSEQIIEKITNQNIIGVEMAIPLENELSTSSFEYKYKKTEELDFFFNIKEKAEKLIDNDSEGLSFISNSDDRCIIESLNKQENLEEAISSYKSECSKDTKESKKLTKEIARKIAVEVFNKIKSEEFRDTDTGAIIYNAFRKFINMVNVDVLELKKEFIFDKNVLTNSIFYLSLGVDGSIITNLNDLSKDIMRIINCTNYDLDLRLIKSEEITNLTNQAKIDVKKMIDDNSKELDKIENSKIRYILWK